MGYSSMGAVFEFMLQYSHMKRSTIVSFIALVVVFILIVFQMTVPAIRDFVRGEVFMIPFAVFLVLGITLFVQAYREKEKNLTRKFLLLTSGSAIGVPLGVILHNLIYGLMIILFGEGIWERWGMMDEPVFFIISLLVLPILFLIGVVGTVVIMIKKKIRNA